MGYETILGTIQTELESVTDVGVVHDYGRHTRDYSDYLDLFKTTIDDVDQIRGWMISYRGFPEAAPLPEFGHIPGLRDHEFIIDGFLRLDDSAASEKTFGTLVEAVCNELDGSATLHDGSTYPGASRAIAVIDLMIFGDVLCHHVNIRQMVTEHVTN
jgi:hypothetical protein